MLPDYPEDPLYTRSDWPPPALITPKADMRHTVLVVDDDPNTRSRLRASLPPRSFAVVEAPDPVSALTLLLWTPVALAVINPGTRRSQDVTPSAVDLLKCLRTEPAFTNVPVLLLAD